MSGIGWNDYNCCPLLQFTEYELAEHDKQIREKAIDEIIPKAFEWLMKMDIIDCDGCNYQSECVNRNMACFVVMAEKYFEQLKEQKNE